MAENIAVLDLGTNTFNLIIATIDKSADKGLQILYNDKIAVKLGQGGINKGYITEEAFKRGFDAIGYHMETIRKYPGTKIYALGTSALRGASNGKDFIEKIKNSFGIDVNIIDGDKEASLIYYGVIHSMQMSDRPDLIIDIGGGSVEFIIANKHELIWEKSFNIGMARLLEKFSPSDPITEEEVLKIQEYLNEILAPLFEEVKKHELRALIGSSGSFDTLVDMVHARFLSTMPKRSSTSFDFDLNHYNILHDDIIKSTRQQRLSMPGMIEMRADMMVLAVILIKLVFERINVRQMIQSSFALKEGVIYKLIEQGNI